MASVGYDNSVRIWDLNTMQVTAIIEDKGSKIEKDYQINSLSWSLYSKEELLCIVTVAGFVKVIDVKKGKIVSKIHVSPQTVFDVDWNINGIVACSESSTV
jgi:WD40 repeat protein